MHVCISSKHQGMVFILILSTFPDIKLSSLKSKMTPPKNVQTFIFEANKF